MDKEYFEKLKQVSKVMVTTSKDLVEIPNGVYTKTNLHGAKLYFLVKQDKHLIIAINSDGSCSLDIVLRKGKPLELEYYLFEKWKLCSYNEAYEAYKKVLKQTDELMGTKGSIDRLTDKQKEAIAKQYFDNSF